MNRLQHCAAAPSLTVLPSVEFQKRDNSASANTNYFIKEVPNPGHGAPILCIFKNIDIESISSIGAVAGHQYYDVAHALGSEH